MRLTLAPGDRVVASFPFRDRIVIITEMGCVYEIACEYNGTFDEIQIRRMGDVK